MALFKFRRSGSSDEPAATPIQPESIEAMRRRAKHRLIGAAVLVLIGVIGLPMLFDKQPRPISVDIPIEIPDRNKVRPLSIPDPAATPVPIAEAPAPKASAIPAEEPPAPAPLAAASEAPKLPAPVEPMAAEKVSEKAVPAPLKPDEADKVQALLDGKAVDKKTASGSGRFVVQVGAFSDAARAREARLKVEHAGLKTYTQEVETKDGHRIRVRVGPFENKAEADKAALRIKKLGLPAAILTL